MLSSTSMKLLIEEKKKKSFYLQGMAFSIEERQLLGIHGLLPAAVKTQEEQLELCRLNLERYPDDLLKYIYLIGLLVCIYSLK